MQTFKNSTENVAFSVKIIYFKILNTSINISNTVAKIGEEKCEMASYYHLIHSISTPHGKF